MHRLRLPLVALVAGLVLVAAGCGGSSKTSGSGGGSIPASAGLVPATSPAYVYANTDFGGDQWTNLNSLLAKFPDKDLAIGQIQASMEKQGVDWNDVKKALGPDTGASVLAFTGATKAFLLTQPADAAELNALIEKLDQAGTSPKQTAKRDIDGWTVVADSDATLDAVAAASDKGPTLADDDTFKTAFDALPDDALAKVYVNGAAIKAAAAKAATAGGAAATGAGALGSLGALQSIAASLEATQDGIGFDAVIEGDLGVKTFKSELANEVPAGVLLYLSFDNLGAQITKLKANPQFGQFSTALTALGLSTDEVANLFAGEGAIYVRAGSPLPEVTFVLAETDATAAAATLDKITTAASAALGTTVQSVTVDGKPAKKLSVRGVPIYYAAVDGKLVITDSEAGITGLTGSGDKLADDPTFKEASDAAGVPDETTGLLYVNIKDTVPLIDSFASIAGQALPPQATSNLEHVRSFIAYGTASGTTNTFKAFLQIK